MNDGFSHCLKKSPPGMQVYAAFVVVFTVLFITLLVQGNYGKQETARGLIRNESFYRVAASKVGNVVELYVHEGESVEKGAPLFRVALPWQDVKDQQNGKSMLTETIARLNETQNEIKKEVTLQQLEWETLKNKKRFFSSD